MDDPERSTLDVHINTHTMLVVNASAVGGQRQPTWGDRLRRRHFLKATGRSNIVAIRRSRKDFGFDGEVVRPYTATSLAKCSDEPDDDIS